MELCKPTNHVFPNWGMEYIFIKRPIYMSCFPTRTGLSHIETGDPTRQFVRFYRNQYQKTKERFNSSVLCISILDNGFHLLSGNLTVCYWKLPFIVDIPIKHGNFPSFFVCLPGRVSSIRACTSKKKSDSRLLIVSHISAAIWPLHDLQRAVQALRNVMVNWKLVGGFNTWDFNGISMVNIWLLYGKYIWLMMVNTYTGWWFQHIGAWVISHVPMFHITQPWSVYGL